MRRQRALLGAELGTHIPDHATGVSLAGVDQDVVDLGDDLNHGQGLLQAGI